MAAPVSRVAIGGVGGSGTRVFAAILREFGFFIGGDINGPNDNLWFSILFKRKSVLLYGNEQLNALYTAFVDRMQGRAPTDPVVVAMVHDLATRERHIGKSEEWTQKRVDSFLTGSGERPGRWGWKAPNTHVFIERLLEFDPDLHYVHIVRDAFYMASSKNQSQLKLWGDVFLDREVRTDAQDAFAFWCAVHRRIALLRHRFPERVVILSHDRICSDPEAEVRRFAAAVALEPAEDVVTRAAALVGPPRPKASDKPDLSSTFDKADIAFAREFLASF